MNANKNRTTDVEGQKYVIMVGIPVMEYYTVEQVRQMLHVSRDKVHSWRHLEEDPLPVIYLPGRYRGGVIQRDALNNWIVRNGKTAKGGSPEEFFA